MKIYDIDVFANTCGYFYNACVEESFNCNNGYNCRHPEQEELEFNKKTGKTVGRCHAFSCPLGAEADEEDFIDPDVDQNGYDTYEEGHFIIVEEEEK
jgi:hypothetical protein